ncbi:MAG: DUF5990 family protein [Candidatus Sericytochromatia bacterium]
MRAAGVIQISLLYQQLPHRDDPNLEIGLQSKKGDILAGEALREASSAEADLLFSCSLKASLKQDQSLDFSGPFVQGTAGARFLYLSWKRRDPGSEGPYFWRVKIPLVGIQREWLAAEGADGIQLRADISGRKPHENHPIDWRRV